VIETAVRTHPGRIKPVNEDAAALVTVGPQADERERLALVVCDGVGGRQAGSYASQWSLARIAEQLTDHWWLLEGHDAHWQQDVHDRLVALLAQTDRHLVETAETSPELHGMATTLAALLFLGDWYCALHVGDSRIYLLRGETLRQLTIDHSWAEEQLRLGELSPEAIRASPYRDQLMQVLGLGRPLEPTITFGRTVPGDRFLVCSDGLTKHATPAEIGQLLHHGTAATQIAEALVARALAGGGSDNVTVAIGVVRGASRLRLVEPEAATLRLDGTRPREVVVAPTSRAPRRLLLGAVAAALVATIGLITWWITRGPITGQATEGTQRPPPRQAPAPLAPGAPSGAPSGAPGAPPAARSVNSSSPSTLGVPQ
jgi:protein phosphatase